ncbi:Putative phage tail protein [Phyllobacterium sp. CL33Tsu]|uniref:phage tail protein n=1 Tax=Phyllobacterium sp. CL33Tsu TaxID=1798191 RepID=UPI0008E2450F|nr:phage tail protein [Phyllobacterium sp. CL33Tsu]SFJ55144.1 Putative phage tail protein [Phyllobacterium sp. CL33Tsu]
MAVFTGLATAIGGLLGGTFLSGGLGAILLKAAVGIGLNLIAKAIAGKPEKPQFSINGQLQSGGDVARSIILGHTVTAGSLVYANTWGDGGKTPNEYFTQVIAISDIPINGIIQLWVNGEPVTISGTLDPDDKGFQIPEYRKGSDNHLWIRFHDGTQSAADSLLVNRVSSSSHPWQSSRIGYGVAYAVVTAEVDPEFFTGFPQFKFEVQGARLYDPSRDSSVGGAGAQRWDNPATWGGDGDDLPAVQIYNLLRGFNYGSQWFYGLQGVSAARLPPTDWIAQINKCRALIAGPVGPEPQYYTGGEIHVGAQIADAIEALLTGCQGKLSEIGGVYKIHVGEPDAAVFAFADSDILSTEEQDFTPFFGLADTINGVNATYPEPAEGWNTKTAPAIHNAAFEALDGNRRLMADIQLDMVYRSSQVQRLMKSALAEARRARRHTLVLGPAAWVLEPGDVIIWNSERNGYVDKLFRVDGVSDRANLDVMLDITEVDPSDYDWDQEHDYTPPVFGPVGPVRPQPQPIVDWNVEPAVILDNNGSPRRPAILLSWDGDQADVIGVEFEVRLATSLITVYQGRTDQPDKGSVLISQGLLPNTLYGVRGRYIPGTPRPVEWSAWLNVMTFNILLGSEDVYLGDIVDEINNELSGHLEWLAEGTHYARDEMDRLNSLAAQNGAQSALDKFELLAEVGKVSAKYSREIQVVATATEAAVIRIEELTVKVDTDIANAIDSLSASIAVVDGKTIANANAITALNVSVGNFSASGLFRTTVEATEAGALSTIGLSASATGGGATVQAALFISAKAGGISTVMVLADRFTITNGSTPEFPFIFQGGVLTMNATRVNTVTAGMLRSSDSKMQVDLTNRRILIAD